MFTTVGPEQEYFLIDEQYYYERPDLLTTGRTLFGAKPPKGHELDEHYFGSIPERILAYMMETERELAKLGVPVKTRHNEVAPNQYELAPIFENSNVSCDHQQLTMQLLQNTARRYGLVCLLHEKPFAGVNGSGKHNNWSMGTDIGREPARARRHAEREHPVPVLLHGRRGGRQQASGAAAGVGREHRAGPPPRRQRGAAGDHLDLPRRRAGEGLRRDRGGTAAVDSDNGFLGLGTPVLPPLPLHGGDRNRTSPFAFTGNKFEFRMLGSSSSLGFPNTVLNTIAAEAIDELADALETKLGAGASLAEAVIDIVKDSYNANQQIVFGGDNYAEEWHTEAEARGLYNLRSTLDALPWFVHEQTVDVMGKYGVLSERELEARYEVGVEQYERRSTSRRRPRRRSPARCSCRRPCATSTSCSSPAARASPTSRAAHRAVPQGDRRAGEGQRATRPGGHRARQVHARHGAPGDGRRPRGGRQARAARRRRPVAAAEVLEMLFIK